MYGLSSKSGYIDGFVSSEPCNYYWQQQDANRQGFGAPSQPLASENAGQVAWDLSQEQHRYFESAAAYQAHPAYMRSNCAGRPTHSVVAFGFGGTFVVIKPSQPSYYQQQPSSTVEVHKLASFTQQPTAGLDASGVENKSKNDILKWIDERISNCSREEVDNRNLQSLPLIWGALKIAFEHHGKLRSPAGFTSEGSGPDAAVGQLILTASSWGPHTDSQSCLQQMPLEESLQATSIKIKGLLLSGKTEQALKCAEESHSWGLGLVLASQLGEKCYFQTVSEMGHHQFTPGALRTFSLLMGGCFSDNNADYTQEQRNILDNWHEHLALIAANRTFGDEGVMTRLGDLLWSHKQEVAAAHLCYLLVDQNSEAFFTDGRMQLIGADHWKYPRTFVTPLAIKRTQLYELIKTRANPQFLLACFQGYKLVYANMLAEAGQMEEALRYSRDVLRTLKTVNNMEACRQAATELETRLLQSLEKSTYGKFAGRILSSTFSYVMSSLPSPRIRSFNSSTSMPSPDKHQSNKNSFPARSASEPDLSKHYENTPKPPNPGFLRRVGSNVASLVTRSKQENSEGSDIHFDGAYVESGEVNQGHYNQAMQQLNAKPPIQSSTGLYVHCSRYISSFNKDSQLVRTLMSPQLPPILKIGGRKPQVQRIEV